MQNGDLIKNYKPCLVGREIKLFKFSNDPLDKNSNKWVSLLDLCHNSNVFLFNPPFFKLDSIDNLNNSLDDSYKLEGIYKKRRFKGKQINRQQLIVKQKPFIFQHVKRYNRKKRKTLCMGGAFKTEKMLQNIDFFFIFLLEMNEAGRTDVMLDPRVYPFLADGETVKRLDI